MKLRTTRKEIYARANKVFKVGYADVQHLFKDNGETAGALVDLLAKQMGRCDRALTLEGREEREQQLIGMQKALREILPGNYYRQIVKDAEVRANW